jgi:hypothetical protein
VNNFNRKIARVLEREPEAAGRLPEKLSLKTERAKILEGTRNEFNLRIKGIKRFSEKGAEQSVSNQVGLNITKWELDQTKKLVQRRNLQKKARAKRVQIDVKKGTATEEEKAAQRPIEITEPGKKSRKKPDAKQVEVGRMTTKEFRKFSEAMEAQVKQSYALEGYEQYKRNYIKSLEDNFGTSTAKPLVDKLKEMNAQAVFEQSSKNPDLSISFHYTSAMAPEEIIEHMFEAWGFERDGDLWDETDDGEELPW